MGILIGNRVEGLQYLRTSYQDAVSVIPKVQGKFSGVYNTPKAEQRLKIFRETVAELQRIMEENINDLDENVRYVCEMYGILQSERIHDAAYAVSADHHAVL